MISEFIFFEEDATKEEKRHYVNLKIEIRELLKNDFNRKIVSEILLDLRKDVSGSARKRLFELYKDFGLHSVSYKKLKSWRWEQVSQGIQELTQMRVAESYGFITRFINDKRPTIRKQAEIAVVTLKPEGLNYFLDTTKHKISEWQQLKLLEVVRNQPDYLPPSFKIWLTSKNKYVVLFALRLIKYYDQNDANASIIELVKHRNNQIKQEAIACIKTFHIAKAGETLKTVFWKCTADVKIAILDALGSLGCSDDIKFMQLIEKKEINFSVRSKALSSINMISPESILPSEGILDTGNYQIPEDIKPKKMQVMKSERTMEDVIQVNPEVLDPMTTIAQGDTAPSESSQENTEIPTPADAEALDGPEPSGEGPEIWTKNYPPVPEEILEMEIDMEVVPAAWEALDEDAVAEEPREPTETRSMGALDKIENDSAQGDGPSEDMDFDFSVDFLPIVKNLGDPTTLSEIEDESLKVETPLAGIPLIGGEMDTTASPWASDPIEGEAAGLGIRQEDLNFIPIVVENDHKASVAGGEKEIDLSEFEVTAQEVTPTPLPMSAEPILDVLGLEVDFEEIEASRDIPSPVETGPADILDLPVEMEGLNVPPAIMGKEGIDIWELEVVWEEIVGVDRESLWNIEVEHETLFAEGGIGDQELPRWILEEISGPSVPGKDQGGIKMEGPEWESKESKMIDELEAWIKLIPAPEYYENEIEGHMQLLDDIELFGDEREVPLLQELMEKEDRQVAQLRIRDIMSRFSGQSQETENDPEILTMDESRATYSIFEEFFRPCDTESKLILLDEIAHIGDEKELYFLERLLEDSEPRIRQTASKVLETLRERLSLSKTALEEADLVYDETDFDRRAAAGFGQLLDEMEIAPSIAPSIFDIGFELSEDFGGNGKSDTKPDGESLLTWFCPFSKKTKSKGNG